jgi:hypothetical protein
MSDEPHVNPLPTLSYYTEEQSPALRLLVRLVLLAGAANGVVSAISCIAGFLPPWSIPPQAVDVALLIGQVLAWLTAAISYLVFIKTGNARMIAISAQGAALLLDACYDVRQIFLYPQFGYGIVMATAMIADWLLPLPVIVILVRPDMRRHAGGLT